jgi:hypothetical protein
MVLKEQVEYGRLAHKDGNERMADGGVGACGCGV